jgi:hypothetical protein
VPGRGRWTVGVARRLRRRDVELRVSTVRILFVFDPWRAAVLLVAGDKARRWTAWYEEAIPVAEQRYERYLVERASEQQNTSVEDGG